MAVIHQANFQATEDHFGHYKLNHTKFDQFGSHEFKGEATQVKTLSSVYCSPDMNIST